jgi:thioester reductase-like protein
LYVRAREADHGERPEAILASYVLWKPSIASLLNTVIGDASKPLLRMSEEECHHLADRVDSIRHAGALVDWIRPLSDYLGQEVFKWANSRPYAVVSLLYNPLTTYAGQSSLS